MSNIFLNPFKVQTVNNSSPDLRSEIISIIDCVDLCSDISRPNKGIKGKFSSCSIFHLPMWSSKGALARKSRDIVLHLSAKSSLFLFLSTAGVSWVSSAL